MGNHTGSGWPPAGEPRWTFSPPSRGSPGLSKRGGGDVAFEWPKGSIGWAQPAVVRFLKELNLYEALCDGCAFGMTDADGRPVLKPWRIVTSSAGLAFTLSA